MTPKQAAYRKHLIQLIQVNKTRVFAGDEERRDYLDDGFGVRTLTKLSITQLEQVADYVQGRKPRAIRHQASGKQCYYLRQLWAAKSKQKDDISLIRYCGRILGTYPMRIELLTPEQIGKMIVAVKHLKAKNAI